MLYLSLHRCAHATGPRGRGAAEGLPAPRQLLPQPAQPRQSARSGAGRAHRHPLHAVGQAASVGLRWGARRCRRSVGHARQKPGRPRGRSRPAQVAAAAPPGTERERRPPPPRLEAALSSPPGGAGPPQSARPGRNFPARGRQRRRSLPRRCPGPRDRAAALLFLTCRGEAGPAGPAPGCGGLGPPAPRGALRPAAARRLPAAGRPSGRWGSRRRASRPPSSARGGAPGPASPSPRAPRPAPARSREERSRGRRWRRGGLCGMRPRPPIAGWRREGTRQPLWGNNTV